ncbi:MAG: MBL fold metallo-hydrolase [Dysgonamonadaceae bacterium]|jgi:phosphoribosyl 1,2-cyclic phosphodiesterase|nr:MBL fold metallo-hydrolase [Dysgonamonadaceae bacterium]
MALQFLSLASGSSGNCYYLGTGNYGILLDAGISFRTIKQRLKENAIEIEQIMAVFITHDHLDHIKSVGGLGEAQGIPIYTTQLIHTGIENNRYVDAKLYTSRKIIEKNRAVTVKDFSITAFNVPHDANDCVGYLIQYEHHNFVLATDVGHIDETVGSYIRIANHLIIEANYDKEMLLQGHYPDFLKERIMNGSGHLCNSETADFLAANFDSRLKNIWLCHLSKNNNHPILAYKAVKLAFDQLGICIGKDVNLATLQRTASSELYLLK